MSDAPHEHIAALSANKALPTTSPRFDTPIRRLPRNNKPHEVNNKRLSLNINVLPLE